MLRELSDRAQQTETVYRSFDLIDCEVRAGGDGFTFEGVASVVDAPYSVTDQLGTFTETIRAGAFNKTLKDSKADVALFLNHDYRGIPLATRASGTATFTADPNLRVSARLNPQRSDVNDVKIAVDDGILRQMSIGFTVPKQRDKWNDDFTERTISEVRLIESSIVWRGANHHTSGAMRSLDELLESSDDWTEDEIRRAIAHLQKRVAPQSYTFNNSGVVGITDFVEQANSALLTMNEARFAERDAADRERLERLLLLRP